MKLILGRDGMGADADEADFDAWVAFVCARIDVMTGLDVTVEYRGARDVQDDCIIADDADRQTIHDAIQLLWDAFCADPTLWPARTV